jgi:LPXTG-motif cell wall-anchored protein
MNLSPILRDGNPVDVITDENGYALFTNLPAWIFYVLEVNPPAGYLLNTTFLGGERLSEDLFIETSDQFALGTITLAKEAANGTPLSGGTFTLTGTDYNSDPIQRTATSKNGVVTFSDLPLGEYSVRETTAPTGYTLSNTEITAIVEYNSTKTEVVVTITSENDTIVNDPLPYGSIELYKTDGSDPLAGAVFELYTTNGDTVGTATSDSSGRVRFTRVPLGSYSIREITAPNGYARSSIIAIAQITENDYATTVRADPYSIVNQWIEIPKTGDEANPWLWAGVAVFAIVGVIFLLIFRRISAHAEGNNNNMV